MVSLMDDITTSWRPELRELMRLSNVPLVNSNLTPRCLPSAAATSGSTPTIFPFSTNSIGAYVASVPTLMTPAARMSAGSLANSGASLFAAPAPAPAPSAPEPWPAAVWSPQALSSREAVVAARAVARARRVGMRTAMAVLSLGDGVRGARGNGGRDAGRSVGPRSQATTRRRFTPGSSAPRTWPFGAAAVRWRNRTTSAVMTSPGRTLGMPGG